MESTPQAPYRTTFENVAEMQDYVGKELGISDWILIEQNRINLFAEATGDHQWIHLDAERAAKESPYKTTIAHGFLVLSMASNICYQTFEIKNLSAAINYGLDRVRFPNATPSGGYLRGHVTLLEFEEIPGGAKFKTSIVFEIKGQEKPACVAEVLSQVYG